MSSTGAYFCCDDLRREAVRKLNDLNQNGIDFLEVADHELIGIDDAKRQRVLYVHFVLTPTNAFLDGIGVSNVIIEGGERIAKIHIDEVVRDVKTLKVTVTPRGDYSTYTLRLVKTTPGKPPLAGLDPHLAEIEFSFKVECASDFDCRVSDICPPETEATPPIDYLARDYGSFRRLMLDRLSLLLPGWRERTPADLAVTLVEMLAYVGDHLAYQQDAIATEAYLGTARRRVSVRRHARLVDYLLRDGCNARAFVHVHVNAKVPKLSLDTKFLTRVEGLPGHFAQNTSQYDQAIAAGALAFEPMHEPALDPDHNILYFYTWQSANCCLPRGATSATLLGWHPNLLDGTYLLFGERIGPRKGKEADADRDHRHVVRLTGLPGHVQDLLTTGPAIDLTEIQWDAGDALPFPLCISATILNDQGDEELLTDVSTAIGNIVLTDHGLTTTEHLPPVPEPVLFRPAPDDGNPCTRESDVAVLPRFRPRLSRGPLTQQGRLAPPTAGEDSPPAFDPAASAAAAMRWSLENVLPVIQLTSPPPPPPPTETWHVRRDLFESDSADRHFVAEVEEDGLDTLRFGDDEYGRQPIANTEFVATYRVGNGTEGNIGITAIAHAVTGDPAIDFAWNPMPARGGTNPESLEHARQSAPAAFRIQERAVTEADYAEVSQRHPEVSRAAATYRWTGSWNTVFDTIDRKGGAALDDTFRADLRQHVERFRVVANDLEIDTPRFVSLEVALTICVLSGYYRSDVAAALRDVFAAGTRRDGTPGFFHPDNFTFDQDVVMSAIVAAAAAVDGVDGVTVDIFRRQGSPATNAKASGILPIGRLEIARLEDSRNFPEHGSLTLTMRGGA
jgi:hypothetical protein